jgi:hypothetical protein
MMTIGIVDLLPAGEHVLGITITGQNAKSTTYLFGVDKFEFVPVER